jgi:hypothetical protein
MGQRYEFPPNEFLAKAVEEKGASWVAQELGVPDPTLRQHLKRNKLPTRQKAKPLEASEALKRVAKLAS